MVHCRNSTPYKNPPDMAEYYNNVRRNGNNNDIEFYSNGGGEFNEYGQSTIPIGHANSVIIEDYRSKISAAECLVHFLSYIRTS